MKYLEDIPEVIAFLGSRKNRVPVSLFLVLCFNALLAPGVQAATPNDVSRFTAYAIGLLGLGTVALSVYLFFVIFQPERF